MSACAQAAALLGFAAILLVGSVGKEDAWANPGAQPLAPLAISTATVADRDRNMGNTPMHVAARDCDVQALRSQIAAGIPLTANHLGDTPLHALFWKRYAVTAKLYTDTGPAAPEAACAEAAAILLKAGVPVGNRNGFGNSALHLAASAGDYPSISVLLDNGADVNAKNKDEETPLFFAVDADKLTVADLLVHRGATPNAVELTRRVTPLFRARSAGMVSMLLTAGADPKIRAKNGETPLHFYARLKENSEKMIQTLMAAGADPAVVAQNGETAQAVAAREQNTVALAALTGGAPAK